MVSLLNKITKWSKYSRNPYSNIRIECPLFFPAHPWVWVSGRMLFVLGNLNLIFLPFVARLAQVKKLSGKSLKRLLRDFPLCFLDLLSAYKVLPKSLKIFNTQDTIILTWLHLNAHQDFRILKYTNSDSQATKSWILRASSVVTRTAVAKLAE